VRCPFPVILFLLLVSVPAAWPAEIILGIPGTNGWRPLQFPKIKQHTHYAVIDAGQEAFLQAESECSASAMYLPAEHIDLGTTPRLLWRWRVDQGLDIADERAKAGDDFAARVYVMFQFDPEHASLWQRARHAVATTSEPAGTRWDNPFASTSKTVSRGPGPLAQWRSEEADVRSDYVSLFGHEPPPILAVGVMTDSDNSCQEAAARYGELGFAGP
jgi:hypothetical protein